MERQGQRRSNERGDGEKPFRCLCGSLLARLVPEGIELKCRRCKRQIIVPLEPHGREKIEMAKAGFDLTNKLS